MVEVSDESPVVMALRKCPVGVSGLDEVTGGGLPYGRVSLVCGGPVSYTHLTLPTNREV